MCAHPQRPRVTSPLFRLVRPGRSRLFLIAGRSEASPRRAGHTSLYYCVQTIRTGESPQYLLNKNRAKLYCIHLRHDFDGAGGGLRSLIHLNLYRDAFLHFLAVADSAYLAIIGIM